jgi:hypothetical protein
MQVVDTFPAGTLEHQKNIAANRRERKQIVILWRCHSFMDFEGILTMPL